MREFLLILHFLGLALGLGTNFALFYLRITRSKMNSEEAKKDALRSLALGLLGNIGVILLIGSGAIMMNPYWSSLMESHILLAKLSLVVILIILMVFINLNSMKAKKEQGGQGLIVTAKLGKISLPLVISIMVLAIVFFQ